MRHPHRWIQDSTMHAHDNLIIAEKVFQLRVRVNVEIRLGLAPIFSLFIILVTLAVFIILLTGLISISIIVRMVNLSISECSHTSWTRLTIPMNPLATSSDSSRVKALTKYALACLYKVGFGGFFARATGLPCRDAPGVESRDCWPLVASEICRADVGCAR